MQTKLDLPGSHEHDAAWHDQNVAAKIAPLLSRLNPTYSVHVYVSAAGDEAIKNENASTGQSVWVHRTDGKYVSWAEWNTPGHVLETIILGQWSTKEDCYLAEQAGVQAVRVLADQGLYM